MQFRDLTNLPPVPPPPPPVSGPPMTPGGPALPWTVADVEYGGVMGSPTRLLPTKIRPDGTRGELLVPGSDEAMLYARCAWLEGEVQRLKLEAETAVLLSPVVPILGPTAVPFEVPTEPTTPTDPPTSAEPVQTAANEFAPPTVTTNPVPPEETADKRSRAVAALLADPGLSNYALAEIAGCSGEYIRVTRHQLTAEGRLVAPAKGVNPTNHELAAELVPEVVGGAPLAGTSAE